MPWDRGPGRRPLQRLCSDRQTHTGSGVVPADQRYSHPINKEVFTQLNRSYVRGKLQSGRCDPHWKTMQDELQEELRLGRMSGPYAAPSWWPRPAVGFSGDQTLLPLPSDNITSSFCFAVVQSDKVRRCEDFKRSGVNSTLVLHDTPHHDDIPVFVELLRAQHGLGLQPELWAQDLHGAYRQLGLRDPSDAFCVLMTPAGPVLLQHHALGFGATASVSGFCRFADSICYLARRLMAILTGHYVDDFIGAELALNAPNSFHAFADVFRSLGLRMKESKALEGPGHHDGDHPGRDHPPTTP